MCSQLLIVKALWSDGDDSNKAVIAEEDCGSVGPAIEAQIGKHLPGWDWQTLLKRRAIPDGCRRFWTIDPVDGTKGFVRGDQYAVCVALVEDEQVKLGVLGCPRLAPGGHPLFFVAAAGAGSYEVGGAEGKVTRLGAGFPLPLAGARLCESFVPSHSSHAESARLIQQLGLHPESIRMDSQCKYGLVASGRASIYYRRYLGSNYQENIWDHAAGFLVVTEAGGRVTDMAGKIPRFLPQPNLIRHQGLIATNLSAEDHAKLLRAITQE